MIDGKSKKIIIIFITLSIISITTTYYRTMIEEDFKFIKEEVIE